MIDSTNPRVMADNIQQLANRPSGGTTVVANPEGTATSVLTKLEVGESIYSIPQPDTPLFKTKYIDAGSSQTGTLTVDPQLPSGSTIIAVRGAMTRNDTGVRYAIPNPNSTQADYSTEIYLNQGVLTVINNGSKYALNDVTLIIDYIEPVSANTRKKK